MDYSGFHFDLLRSRLRHGHRLRVGDTEQGQAVEGHQTQVRRQGGVK